MQTYTKRNWVVPVLGVGAVVVIVAVTLSVLAWDGQPEGDTDAAPALQLSLGSSDALASCLAFDVATLADMPIAFEGTATGVDGSSVTLSVDRWFKGGAAQTINLDGDHTSPALIAGFDFEPGSQYLISATEGTVNYCGYSGPSSADLLAAYEEAFAS